ncbi:MAG TPA: hypothetical protein VG891_01435 [Rhizomicrobium sp.]|nr:hypothetical protein [Rhizomicrobium sp.]
MRTTLTLDDDVAIRLERMRKERDAGLKEIVNEVLRKGLAQIDAPQQREPFRTRVFDPGGFVDPSKSIKEILREMDEEHDRKKLGLPRVSG